MKIRRRWQQTLIIICLILIAVNFITVETSFSGDNGKVWATDQSIKKNHVLIRSPLRIHPSNPRYFTDDSGKAIYLTGSHTWNNLIDSGNENSLETFDFDSYLDFLKEFQHNFIRLWRLELPKNKCGEEIKIHSPLPWARTGPGIASDGKAKYDLLRFDQSYFDRLRSRVMKARDKGIYVSIMLFEGYGLQFCRLPQDGFPFNGGNNINGIDAGGTSSHKLGNPRVLAIQEAYLKKLIDTVNDLDNVLFEVANEDGGGSLEWHYYIIDFVKKYQATQPNQHPIGMTFRHKGGTNVELFESEAEWISPGPPSIGDKIFPYRDDPPANEGQKIIINDTDHLWGVGGDYKWVWKSFLRGLNPIYMDPYTSKDKEHQSHASKSDRELARKNMGYTLTYSRRVNLVSMVPRNDLSSTTYCLSNIGKEYLIYLPSKGSHRIREKALVDLSESSETFRVEWFNPRTGKTIDGGVVKGGGGKSFRAPFPGDAVLYIYKP